MMDHTVGSLQTLKSPRGPMTQIEQNLTSFKFVQKTYIDVEILERSKTLISFWSF